MIGGPVAGIASRSASVFVDIANRNFRRASDLPSSAGVSDVIYDQLTSLVEDFNVELVESGWRHDIPRTVQAIVDAAPSDQVDPNYRRGPSVQKSGEEALFFTTVPGSELATECACTEYDPWDATARPTP